MFEWDCQTKGKKSILGSIEKALRWKFEYNDDDNSFARQLAALRDLFQRIWKLELSGFGRVDLRPLLRLHKPCKPILQFHGLVFSRVFRGQLEPASAQTEILSLRRVFFRNCNASD